MPRSSSVAALALALSLTALASARQARAQTLQCNDVVCIEASGSHLSAASTTPFPFDARNVTPAYPDVGYQSRTVVPGDGEVSMTISFNIQNGFYPNGIEVTADPPPYWIGVRASDPPANGWTRQCALDVVGVGNPWNFKCTWKSPLNYRVGDVGGSSSIVEVHSVVLIMRSQPFSPAEGTTTFIPVTIKGQRPDLVTAEKTDRLRVVFDGQAHPSRPNNWGWGCGGIQYVTIDGQSVRGRICTLSISAQNYVPSLALLNAPGSIYQDTNTPPFSTAPPAPSPPYTTLGAVGSNQLHAPRMTLLAPGNQTVGGGPPRGLRLIGVTTSTDAVLTSSWTPGAIGQTLTWTRAAPIGTSGNVTSWNQGVPGALLPVDYSGFSGTTVSFAIPCSELPMLLSDRGRLSLFGDEQVAGGDPIAHTYGGPAIQSSYTAAGCGYSTPTNSKSGWPGAIGTGGDYYMPSGAVRSWSLTFNPVTGFDRLGDIAIVDYIPPYNEFLGSGSHAWLGSAGNSLSAQSAQALNHPLLGDPYACIFDRVLVPPASIPADCTQAGAPAPCSAGAPQSYAYRTPRHDELASPTPTSTTNGDPLPEPLTFGLGLDPEDPDYLTDLFLPWPAGIGWNPDMHMGCVPLAQVCDPVSVDPNISPGVVDYGDVQTRCWDAGKRMKASEVTALYWNSAGADSAAYDGWVNTAPTPQDPFAKVIQISYRARATELRQLPEHPQQGVPTNHPNSAWVRNYARIEGGAFDHDGLATTADVPLTALGGYPAVVSNVGRIENRIHPVLVASNSIAVAGGYYRAEQPGWIRVGWHQFRAPIQQLTKVAVEVDLPRGFDPASLNPFVKPPDHSDLPLPANKRHFVDLDANGTPIPAGVMLFSNDIGPGPYTEFRNDWYPSWSTSQIDASDFTVTTRWNTSTQRWTIRIEHPDGKVLGAALYTLAPMTVGVVARRDYPFHDLAPNTANVRLYVDGYDDYLEPGQAAYGEAFGNDSDDFLATTVNLPMLYSAAAAIEVLPRCVDGAAQPAYDVVYSNIGGVSQYGLTGTFIVPRTTQNGVPVELAALVFPPGETAPPLTLPIFEVTTTTNGNYNDEAGEAWQVYDPQMDLSDVLAVRVRHATSLPASPIEGHWRGRFEAHLRVAAPSIGDTISTVGYIRTATLGLSQSKAYNPNPPPEWTPDQLAENLALLNVVGTCPIPLTISKWHDPANPGTRDEGEVVLPGVPFSVSRVGGATDEDVETGVVQGRTEVDGTFVVDVWPGQVVTATETLPAPETIAIAGYEGAFGEGVLTWTPTTPGGLSQSRTIGFEPLALAFGNTCTCATTNQCVSPSACTVSIEDDTVTASCGFAPRNLDCSGAVDFCEVAVGACDPATGACGVAPRTCTEGEPTRVFVTIDDADGPIGVAHCTVVPGQSLTCETHDEGGRQVLTVHRELVCGP